MGRTLHPPQVTLRGMKRRTKVLLGLVGIGVVLLASAEIALAWTNPASTLGLGLSADHAIPTGSNLTIRLSLINGLPLPNPGIITNLRFPDLPGDLTFGSLTWGEYVLPIFPAGCGGFPSGYFPAFVAIYNQSGSPQLLNDLPPWYWEASCPAATGGTSQYNYNWFAPFQTKSVSISVGGFWHSPNTTEPWANATYGKFAPGNYTITAFDAWGQMAELNFTVDSRPTAG